MIDTPNDSWHFNATYDTANHNWREELSHYRPSVDYNITQKISKVVPIFCESYRNVVRRLVCSLVRRFVCLHFITSSSIVKKSSDRHTIRRMTYKTTHDNVIRHTTIESGNVALSSRRRLRHNPKIIKCRIELSCVVSQCRASYHISIQDVVLTGFRRSYCLGWFAMYVSHTVRRNKNF